MPPANRRWLMPYRVSSPKPPPLKLDGKSMLPVHKINDGLAMIPVCVDEKSLIQALDRTQLVLPRRPGLPERATHD
jgi:hypothetical protein